MITRLVRSCTVIAAVLALGGNAFIHTAAAQVPRVISYQGALSADEGPTPDEVTLRFAFYETPEPQSEETPIADWEETHPEVPVENGRFNVFIGSINELPDALFDRDNAYLEVHVDDDPMPRMRLTSTPFALRAAEADVARRVNAGAIDTDALEEGAVTQSKIADDVSFDPPPGSVTTTEIQDGTIASVDLENGAVTQDKIASEAVTGDHITNGTVTGGHIASGTVTGDHIASGTVVRSIVGPGGTSLADDIALQEGSNVDIDMDEENGVITISSDGWFRSSRRFKEDVETLEDPLALVEALRGVRYRWTESGEPDVGVIAEEVAEVLPELVTFDEEDRPSGVHYGKLVSVLIEAVKAQEQTIEAQRSEIDAMEERYETLLDRIEQLERAVRASSSTQ